MRRKQILQTIILIICSANGSLLARTSDGGDEFATIGVSLGGGSGKPSTTASSFNGYNEDSGIAFAGRIHATKYINRNFSLIAGVDALGSVSGIISIGDSASSSLAGVASVGGMIGNYYESRRFFGSVSVGYGAVDVGNVGEPEDDSDGCFLCIDFSDYKEGYNSSGLATRLSFGRSVSEVAFWEFSFVRIDGKTDRLQGGSTSGISFALFQIGIAVR